MSDFTVTTGTAKKEPDYRKTAAELLRRCRDFYADPENERAYQEWKAGKEAKNEDHKDGILGNRGGRAGGADRGGVVHMRACG